MDIKEIIKEEYAKVLLEQHLLENETPEHFGSGENIEVYGYTTENFDICKSAVMLFNKLKEKNLDGMAAKYAAKSAMYLDKFFGIEKEVVQTGSASSDQVEEALDMSNLFSYELGCVGAYVKEDYTRDMAFVKLHFNEIGKRMTTEAKLPDEGFSDSDQMREAKISDKDKKIIQRMLKDPNTKLTSTEKTIIKTLISEGKLNENKLAARTSALRLANAIADLHGARVKVHDLEYTEGKPTSFELSLDGEKFAGGSYTIKLDGDIVNDAARSRGEREGPIYGKIGDTKADFIRGIKRAHRDWKRFMKKENISEARPKKVTKQMWAKMDEYQRMDALLTVIKDPDKAEKFLDKKWNQLPSGFERDMYTEGKKEDPFVPTYGKGDVVHDCPKHVKENKTGREGKVVGHTLTESGAVNYVDVDFGTGKVYENIPTSKLTILEMQEHKHEVKAESTKEYGKSLEKIAKDRQLAMLSKKDKETLLKIAKLMKQANEGAIDISDEQLDALKERLVFYTDKKGRKRRFDTDPAVNRRYRRG